ncbi:hypothetical protein [Leifsonia sp. Leaf264]|uniref:hypothetical protein n=1 Tax=Leifsonia sp. Leaf264 TaxID=1736314 RepID=UPI0006F939D7|nr:hypothetical protein [Leifsonia sp. Leaf264]KQP01405.1 hypothetical protein ASF30_01965 [Leifsonia sp. Leaf264]
MPTARPFPPDAHLLAQAATAEQILDQLSMVTVDRTLTAVEKRARTRAVRKLGRARAMILTRAHHDAGDAAMVVKTGAPIIWAAEIKHLGARRPLR